MISVKLIYLKILFIVIFLNLLGCQKEDKKQGLKVKKKIDLQKNSVLNNYPEKESINTSGRHFSIKQIDERCISYFINFTSELLKKVPISQFKLLGLKSNDFFENIRKLKENKRNQRYPISSLKNMFNSKINSYMNTCEFFFKEKSKLCIKHKDENDEIKCMQLASREYIAHLFSFSEYSLRTSKVIDFAVLTPEKFTQYKAMLENLAMEMVLEEKSIKEVLNFIIETLKDKNNHDSFKVISDIKIALNYLVDKNKLSIFKDKGDLLKINLLLRKDKISLALKKLKKYSLAFNEMTKSRKKTVWGWKLNEKINSYNECRFIINPKDFIKPGQIDCNLTDDGIGIMDRNISKTNGRTKINIYAARISQRIYKISQEVHGLNEKEIISLIKKLQKSYGPLLNFSGALNSTIGTYELPFNSINGSKLLIKNSLNYLVIELNNKQYFENAVTEFSKLKKKKVDKAMSIMEGI